MIHERQVDLNKRIYILVILTVVAALILAACGENSTTADIPLFPGASPDTGTYEDIRKNSEDKEKATQPEMNIEVTSYTTTASLNEVESYYNEQLGEWKLTERTEDPTSKIVMMKWAKDKQELVVFYIPSGAIGDDTVLMIEHAWPK